jgi:putative addiction module component (TIGR02574 family)
MTAQTERHRLACKHRWVLVCGMRTTEIPNFDRLSDQERVALADEIRGSVRNPDALPPPLAHRAELDRRWAAYEANPSIALSCEQFRAQVATLSSDSG